jgi:hypothetical protein
VLTGLLFTYAGFWPAAGADGVRWITDAVCPEITHIYKMLSMKKRDRNWQPRRWSHGILSAPIWFHDYVAKIQGGFVTITLREILWVGFWLAVVMAFLFDNLNPFLWNQAITYPFK